jgi:hypothetical protein
MPTIREIAERRATFRTAARTSADQLLSIMLAALDKVPLEQQNHVVVMLISELQAVTRAHTKDGAR